MHTTTLQSKIHDIRGQKVILDFPICKKKHQEVSC